MTLDLDTPSGAATRARPGIRKLWPHERQAYTDHLLRLDPQSRLERFGMIMDDDAIRRYAVKSYYVGGLVHGFVEDGLVRAVGELQGLLEFPRVRAEAAFSVESGWRRRGIGGALFEAVVLCARNRSILDLDIICQPGNRAMMALARRQGVALHLEEGEAHGRARLDLRSQSTLMSEAMLNATGAMAMLADVQRRLLRA